MAEELYTCCFCGHKFPFKDSHNAAPVIENGMCCEECHKERVMPVRFANLLHSVYRA